MKNILRSLLIIGAVAAAVIGGTVAYFSDEEVSEDNVISAGTIDIAVNNHNPWDSTDQYDFEKLEPSDDVDMDVVLKNVGTNDVVVWKKVEVTNEEDGLQSEPECVAEGGLWTDSDPGSCSLSNINDLSTQFIYSMNINSNPNIKQDWDVRVSDIDDLWIPLGKLATGGTMDVDQNYYFDEDAGNAYQGDKMTIKITFYAEQLGAPGPEHTANGVILDNKSLNSATGYYEYPAVGDQVWGILTWDNSGNYDMRAWGLHGTQYQLQAWDGVNDSDYGMFGSTVSPLLGKVDYSGTESQLTTWANAKLWLRDTSGSWPNANALWEANLVN